MRNKDQSQRSQGWPAVRNEVFFAELNAASNFHAGEVTEITSSHKDDPELPEELKVAVGTIDLY